MQASTAYESAVIQSTYTPSHTATISPGVPLEGGALDTDTVIESDRYEAAKPAVEVEAAKPAVEVEAASEGDSATLTVEVPNDAVVTLNGRSTKSVGVVRQFVSRGLKDGHVYTYVVKAVFNVDGIEKTESKSVKLRVGDVQRIEFEALPAEPKTEDIVTEVKLHVPESAEVRLAGTLSSGTGTVRTFRTKQLVAGQQWKGYTIRVTTTMNGLPISKERTVNVSAGSTTELTFDFDDHAIASR
jgi:uncharacterized protein (TIGR03000 family)